MRPGRIFHELHARHLAADAIAQAIQPSRSDPDRERKVIATLQARAAISGWQLEAQTDGTFLASRWRMSRVLDDVAAVRAFLEQIGAPS